MGFLSSSKSSVATVTNIETHTTSTMRDMGITGAMGVELADIVQHGTTERARIGAKLVDQMITSVGGTYAKLIGGAGDYAAELVGTGAKEKAATIEAGERTVTKLLEAATPESTLLKKAIPYAVAALLGVFLLMRGSK